MEKSGNDYAAAIEEIKALAVASVKGEVKEVGGRKYLIGTKVDGTPVYKEILAEDDTAYPATMNVNTLNALIEYIKAGIQNGEIADKLYVNVDSPVSVSVVTPVNSYGKRKIIVVARRYDFRGFMFGYQHSYEDFVVALRSKFVANDQLKELLGNLKSITSSNEVTTEDNGITQTVVAKAGAKLGSILISPVWMLQPFRTFTEVEQPESLFLLRLTSDGETQYALHETDGGEWAIRAMNEIRAYLKAAFECDLNNNYSDKVFIL